MNGRSFNGLELTHGAHRILIFPYSGTISKEFPQMNKSEATKDISE